MLALNQEAEQSATELDFGLTLGPVAGWTSFEREIVCCGAIAYLREPRNDIRRAGIQAEMFGDYLLRLERREKKGPNSKERRLRIEKLEAFLKPRWKMLIPRAPPKRHVAAISFDLNHSEKKARHAKVSKVLLGMPGTYSKPFGRESRDLVRSFTILHAMDLAHLHGDALLTLHEAKKLVCEQRGSFSFGAALSLDREVLDDAWTEKRPVVHLAAALLSLAYDECQVAYESGLHTPTAIAILGDRLMPKFGIPDRHKLQREIVRFWGYAQYYKELLEKSRSGRETSRYPMDLFGLPPHLELMAVSPSISKVVPNSLVRPLSKACADARNAIERSARKREARMS